MSMSQDEIDRLMSVDEGKESAEGQTAEGQAPGEEAAGTPAADLTSVLERVVTLYSESLQNIFPILVDAEEVQGEPGSPEQGRVGGLLESHPEDAAYFVFKIPSLADSTFVALLDLPLALHISQKMMGQEGEEALSEALLSALNEAFSNVLGAFDTALSEEFGIEVAHSDLKFLEGDIQEVIESEAGLTPDTPASFVTLALKIDDLSGKMGLLLSLTAVQQIFEKHPSAQQPEEPDEVPAPAEAQDEPAAPTAEVPPPAAEPASAPEVPAAKFEQLAPHQTTEAPRGVDLILDVPLGVTVELGRKTLSVKEVLGLVPGSLVELEKLAGEPVDLLVNGKLFAKGEVVVIDENFGVRVSSIISPKERIESLK